MLAAGTTESHGYVAAVIVAIAGQPPVQETANILEHIFRTGLLFQEFDHL